MQTSEAVHVDGQTEITLKDIIQFFDEFYKKILIAGLFGLMVGVLGVILLGSYTATITLNNYSGIDLPRIRYLQSSLPKLAQENQAIKKNEDEEFLSSEKFWEKGIKPNILVNKADSKELLDATALNAAGSKISSIQIIAKAQTKKLAEKKVQLVTNFFIDGSAYIELRDLVRAYELKVISINSNVKKKISSAEVELDYLQKRIKNLNELKAQFPTQTTTLGQVVDAKDSGAKYLPITTQIVAATTDLNGLKETLARYKDEEDQNVVYQKFIDKAKPLIIREDENNKLGEQLIDVVKEIEPTAAAPVQQIAVEEIKVAILAVLTSKAYGLKQIGEIDIAHPAYIKFILAGLISGLFIGLLLAISLKMIRQLKGA